MNAFLAAFAAELGLSDIEANEQWSGYSRHMSDAERERIENQGAVRGKREACLFRELFIEK